MNFKDEIPKCLAIKHGIKITIYFFALHFFFYCYYYFFFFDLIIFFLQIIDGSCIAVGDDAGNVTLFKVTLPPSLPNESTGGVAAIGDTDDGDGSERGAAELGAAPPVPFVQRTKTLMRLSNAAPVRALCFAENGQWLAAGSDQGELRIASLLGSGAESQQTIAAHEGAVLALAYHPNSYHVASLGADGEARLWSLEGAEPARVWSASVKLRSDPTAAVEPWQIAWHPTGKFLAVPAGNTIKCFDHDGGAPSAAPQFGKGHKARVAQLCWSPNGMYLASATAAVDGELLLWDAHKGETFERRKKKNF